MCVSFLLAMSTMCAKASLSNICPKIFVGKTIPDISFGAETSVSTIFEETKVDIFTVAEKQVAKD